MLSVRSYVQQQKVREGKPSARWPQRNQWYRPRATKKMTVELARDGPGQGPFVWPEELKEEESLSEYVLQSYLYVIPLCPSRLDPLSCTLSLSTTTQYPC